MTPAPEVVPRIRHLRVLLSIHSYIYYHLGTSVVSDDKWQAWAEELKVLQAEYPESIGYLDDAFQDWDGSTGMHLGKDPWIQEKAHYVLKLHQKYHSYNPPHAEQTFDPQQGPLNESSIQQPL